MAFACGLDRVKPGPARRGPGKADLAYEAGRSASIEAESPVPPPDRLDVEEREAWAAGADDAYAVVLARYTDMEEQARFADAMAAYSW